MLKPSTLPIQALTLLLEQRIPSAALRLDAPKDSRGTWYLDIRTNGKPLVVQWNEGAGFGISTSSDLKYGEGADEIYPDEASAFRRVEALLR